MKLSGVIALLILLATPAVAATQVVFTGPFTQTTTGTVSCTWPASNTLDCTTSAPLQQNAAILLGPLNSGSSQSGGGGVTPVVTAKNCTVSSGFTNGQAVMQTQNAGGCSFVATCSGGACTGGNVITGWAISAQSCASCYSISSSGVLQGGANAANVTTETDTVTVTATNSTGTSSGRTQTITAYADGAFGAVAAPDSWPTLFTSSSAVSGISNPNAPYSTRPPWSVAGVDYSVGIPTGTTLKNVSTMTTANCGASCTINAGTSITVRNANITLTGWDFCNGNNGTGACVQLIQASGATNLTVTNSFLGVGTNLNPIFNQTATNAQVTFLNDYFDSFGRLDSLNAVTFNLCSSGASSNCGMTLEYSYINRGSQDEIDYGLTNTVKYNVFKSMGETGGHADWIQECGNCNLGTYIADFNTWIQDIGTGTQGVGMFPGTSGTMNATTLEFSYNTVITYTSIAQPNYITQWIFNGSSSVGGGTVGTIGTINNNFNYIDPSGSIANNGTTGYVSHGTPGTTAFSQTGNINLHTTGSWP